MLDWMNRLLKDGEVTAPFRVGTEIYHVLPTRGDFVEIRNPAGEVRRLTYKEILASDEIDLSNPAGLRKATLDLFELPAEGFITHADLAAAEEE